ncbi:MAG: peptidase S9 [Gemmatimonadetes bacterium]|nr:peptidase S9 [Gemmatimonadota bacterium]
MQTRDSHSMTGPSVLCSLVILFSLLTPATGHGQYFGQNKVNYEDFDFKIIKTPHFDVHFYPEEGAAVEDATRMGERWYERLARLFEHEFEKPKPIILYADHPDFQQTNTLSGRLSQGTGGVTEGLKNRVIMPLTGSYWDTDHVLGHELVHAFQYNIAQSRSSAGLRGLMTLPLWLIEGMAEYLSVGREDPLTAMWLRDAIRRDDLPTMTQMTNERRFFPYRFGQALWAYIGGTYGDETIVELFRAALRVGWEPAIEEVLLMSSDSLSADWKQAVQSEYLPLMQGKRDPAESGALLLAPSTGAGNQNISPSVSPDGTKVAFLSEKDLFSIDLFIADARTGEIEKKLISANSDPHFDALGFMETSGDWSPDGRQFVFTVTAQGDNELAIIDVENGNITKKIDVEGIGAIKSPAWSPDGTLIAFSGLKGGISDIYTWNIDTEELDQLTDDKYADLQPTWSPDQSSIAFVSDRYNGSDFDQLTYGKFGLAFLDLESEQLSTLEPFGEVKHTNPQYSPDGRSIYFISDQDGFSDIYQYTFDSGDLRRITNIQTGVSGITGMSPALSVASEAGTILFSVFDNFEFHIYSLQQGQAAAGGQPINAVSSNNPGRLLPPNRHEGLQGTNLIKNYLSDPFTGLVPKDTYPVESAVDYNSSLQLDYVGQPSIGVGTDRYGNYAAGGASVFLSDMLGNRSLGAMLMANGRVKDFGGQTFYLNQENRLNWGLSVGRIPYLYGYSSYGSSGGAVNIQQTTQRIYMSQASYLLAYPFSTTRRIESNIGVQRISFDLERETFQYIMNRWRPIERISLPTRDAVNLATASIALVGDNSNAAFTSPVNGGRYRLETGYAAGTKNFTSVIADVRRYFSPSNAITFAVRGLHFGRYGNNLDPNRTTAAIQPYFLGYETFVRGYSYESFNAAECQASALAIVGMSASGCPSFDRLFGHRLAVANAEIRLPVVGTSQFGFLNFSALPTELFAFADGGFAWNDNDELDYRFVRSDSEKVPVFSTGVGARVNILGFMILEIYYAQPFQRPNKGSHWGFSLAPGW